MAVSVSNLGKNDSAYMYIWMLRWFICIGMRGSVCAFACALKTFQVIKWRQRGTIEERPIHLQEKKGVRRENRIGMALRNEDEMIKLLCQQNTKQTF